MVPSHEERTSGGVASPDEATLTALVDGVLARNPAVGLAIGVVRRGSLDFFSGRGFADITANAPITLDTVFRIGSITKTVTAVAVMQLWEAGLVDLDAPAGDYLRSVKLAPAQDGWRPVTLRHLLTHTAGIPDVLRFRDLLHPSWGPLDARPPLLSVEIGERLPTLSEYYAAGVPIVVEPGSAFAYSNHGFAVLGQIVQDVSGSTLESYFREHIFEPLGMTSTDLTRSDAVVHRLATGYVIGRRGTEAVNDRDWIGHGGGGVYSSSRDISRYLSALLAGGGPILRADTLATMFDGHYRPDSRLPGMGLGFFRHDTGGHRSIGHDGILPGFNSGLLAAPDEGIAVFALTNGSQRAMVWLPAELELFLRRLLNVANDRVRDVVTEHPELWKDLCGRYRLPRVGDLRGRMVLGGGVQVFVGGGRLKLRALTPIPALARGLDLHSDEAADPSVFRLDLTAFRMPSVRLVFAPVPGTGSMAIHSDLGGQPISLYRSPSKGTSR
jgi:CubicO group peptidase (beta-lactamase class C family)